MRRQGFEHRAGSVARIGDLWAGMDDAAGGLAELLDLAERRGPAEKAPKSMPLIEITRTKGVDRRLPPLGELFRIAEFPGR